MRLLIVLAGLGLTACAVTVPYNPSYFPRQLFTEEQRVDGRALVITTPAEDTADWGGAPTSVMGMFNDLRLPLGVIMREATAIAFGDLFRDGADRTNVATGLERYRVAVHPQAMHFKYAYDTGTGDAFRTLISVTLTVDLLDSSGRPRWERSYKSGILAGRFSRCAAPSTTSWTGWSITPCTASRGARPRKSPPRSLAGTARWPTLAATTAEGRRRWGWLGEPGRVAAIAVALPCAVMLAVFTVTAAIAPGMAGRWSAVAGLGSVTLLAALIAVPLLRGSARTWLSEWGGRLPLTGRERAPRRLAMIESTCSGG